MKQLKSLFFLCLTMGFLFSVGGTIAEQAQLSPILGFVGSAALFAAALLASKHSTPFTGISRMGVDVEVWIEDIVGNLFKNNEFAQRAVSHDQYVLNGKVVHIPRAGSASQVKKNLTTFPQTATKRTDDDITYTLDKIYSLPKHIEKLEQYQLSYDKRQSILGEDQSNLIQYAMDSLLYRWAPGASAVLETVGGNTTASVSGATGNRKSFTKASFGPIKLAFDAANVPSAGRVALLNAYHYQQLLDSLSDAERTGFHAMADIPNGIIGRYLGFDIMMRSSVLRYRKVSTVWTVVDEQDNAFAADAADSGASLFWQQGQVCRALGEVNLYESINDPQYYGDVISMNLFLGGRKLRDLGVYAVVEAAA